MNKIIRCKKQDKNNPYVQLQISTDEREITEDDLTTIICCDLTWFNLIIPKSIIKRIATTLYADGYRKLSSNLNNINDKINAEKRAYEKGYKAAIEDGKKPIMESSKDYKKTGVHKLIGWPERKKTISIKNSSDEWDYERAGYANGWNDCLIECTDAIEKPYQYYSSPEEYNQDRG